MLILQNQGMLGTFTPPILQRVPRLRSAQNERSAARVLEVIRIPGLFERPFDGSRLRALVVAFLSQCRTSVETRRKCYS